MTIADLEKPSMPFPHSNHSVPDVRVVDKDTGKVGYFYSMQQIEWILEKQKINRWRVARPHTCKYDE